MANISDILELVSGAINQHITHSLVVLTSEESAKVTWDNPPISGGKQHV